MGSYSYLVVGHLEIDWGKNFNARNHAVLFSKEDRKKVPYFYANEEIIEKYALTRKLRDVLPRLELLGYTLDGAKKFFEDFCQEYPCGNQTIKWSDFLSILSKINVLDKALIPDSEDNPKYYDFGEFAVKFLFSKGSLAKNKMIATADQELGEFLDNVDPYVILRALAENKKNLELDLIWRYMDLVEGGYQTEEEILTDFSPEKKYLLVTEGSSDTNILKAAFDWLRPDIAGFFSFVDMEENYPFSGVGNLTNFFMGLSKIGHGAETIFIFDNDVAGNEACEKCKRIPSRIKTMVLPSLPIFDNFSCIGPHGPAKGEINGKAVAIEMFLDLTYKNKMAPCVRWISYFSKIDAYQGALEVKESYVKRFFSAYKKNDSSYNTENLQILLSSIEKIAKNSI